MFFSGLALDYFVLVLFAFVVGWEERFQNDLFCVYWDVKP